MTVPIDPSVCTCFRSCSSPFLKQFNDVDDTICSSSEFHRLIILSVKKCCLSSVLNLFFFSFSEWPRVILLVSNSKKISKFTFDSLFIILYTTIRSEHIRLSSSDQRPSICSLSWYSTSFRPSIMRVNRRWTFSRSFYPWHNGDSMLRCRIPNVARPMTYTVVLECPLIYTLWIYWWHWVFYSLYCKHEYTAGMASNHR